MFFSSLYAGITIDRFIIYVRTCLYLKVWLSLPLNILQLSRILMEKYALSPNNEVISSLIGEYHPGYVTGIYGNASSGKTTSCLLAAIRVAKNNKVIFVDTESSFDSDRLKQLCDEDFNKILENIFLIQPKSFDGQQQTIEKMHRICNNEKIKLVVVDTIGNHYRVAVNENPKIINSMMAIQVQTLIRIARDMNKVVLVTNQAVSRMNEKDEINMVGGKLISNMCRCIIELNKKDSRRYATLIKYKMENEETTNPNIGKKVEFEIREKGLFLR